MNQNTRNTDDDSGSKDDPKLHENRYTDEQLEESIDYLLKSMDLNRDGFIDYAEYMKQHV